MVGTTNTNEVERKVYNYEHLILWMDGSDYADHSKNNIYVAPSGNGSACNVPRTILTYGTHPCYYNSGTGSFIRIGNFNFPMKNTTITCWGNITTSTQWARYCDFGHASGGVSDLAIGHGSNVCVNYGGRQGASGNAMDFYSPNNTCSLNTWYFVSYTVDTNKFIGYINATQQNTVTTSSSWAWPAENITTTNGLFLSNWNTSENGIGYISDFRVYDYTMTPAELTTLYNEGPKHH